MSSRYPQPVFDYCARVALKIAIQESWQLYWEELIKTLFTQSGDKGLQDELGIPSSVPPYDYTSPDSIDALIKSVEDELSTIGEDGKLANIDLQNRLKTQEVLHSMSTVSKVLHDSAMAVIRHLGG